RVRRPTLFSLWRKARRENSAASRLLGSTSLRFALHGWQRMSPFALSGIIARRYLAAGRATVLHPFLLFHMYRDFTL
ncbi:hypothetical protein, partial [Thiolapillus sp.]